jgi:D-serine deaminase-like pyridoxal phosphate-dependent protein
MTSLAELPTPCLLLDLDRMEANVSRMRAQLARCGVPLRAHVKTCKSIEVAQRMMESPSGPIAVSTLREAEQFLAHGVTDILYAVGIAPGKLDAVVALRARGAELSLVVDNLESARAVAARQAEIPVLIEIDSDGHRAGVRPGDTLLLQLAAELAGGARLLGVMTHAGASYECTSDAAIARMAEQERSAAVTAAERLRAAGYAAPVVSVGSTPTATFAQQLSGVSEVRAGVFVFQDLVMAGLGVCDLADIALSVLVSVIGQRPDKGWVLTDGGWMALSRDRGTAKQRVDQGYGLVCDLDGRALEPLIVADTNQEHGFVRRRDGERWDSGAISVGTRWRILPNHACATAAQHDRYHVLRGGSEVVATWPRFGGW